MSTHPPGAEPGALAALTPPKGSWPCQTAPIVVGVHPRLIAFLYVLLRNGASAPGDVEQIAVNVQGYTKGDTEVDYTNPHLESYALSLATFLTSDAQPLPS